MDNVKNDSVIIKDVPSKIEIANFGNSHGLYGFNYVDIGQKHVCFNFSLPSQSMSYNYLIMDQYKDRFKSGGIVFICVSFQSFFGKTNTEDKNFISMNRRYYSFLDEKHIKKYDNFERFLNGFPILIVNPVRAIRKILYGDDIDNWADVTNQQDAVKHGFNRVAHWTDPRKELYVNVEELNSLYKIIDLCRSIDVQPVLITTPFLYEYVSPILRNNKKFLDKFYEIINEIVVKKNVVYLDYSQNINYVKNYDFFFNTDHMNKVGAKKFTIELISKFVK